VLVDGYSVLHTWARFQTRAGRAQPLARQREELIRLLRQYGDATGRRVTIVFDGYAAKRKPETEVTPGIEVLYSEAGKTADDVIERVVSLLPNRGELLVVTSDHAERRTVESLGAESRCGEVFEEEVEAALRALAQSVKQHSRSRRPGRLGDRL
jgi:predicted RNA-binding protein with PIN domain